MPLEEILCWDQDPARCRPGHTLQWCQAQISWHLRRFCISATGSLLNSGQVTWNAPASWFPKCLPVTIFLSERMRQREFPAKGYLQVHTVCPYAATSNKSLTLSFPSRFPWDQFCGASTNLCRLLQFRGQAGLAPQLFVDMVSLQMFVKWSFDVQLSTATVFKNKRDTGNQSAQQEQSSSRAASTSPKSSVLAWNAPEKGKECSAPLSLTEEQQHLYWGQREEPFQGF